IGLHLAKKDSAPVRATGRGLVKGMPFVLSALSTLGIAAMSWVGGGIIVHGLEHFHLTPVPHWVHGTAVAAANAVPAAHGVVEWLVQAIGSGIVGLIVGGVIVGALKLVKRH